MKNINITRNLDTRPLKGLDLLNTGRRLARAAAVAAGLLAGGWAHSGTYSNAGASVTVTLDASTIGNFTSSPLSLDPATAKVTVGDYKRQYGNGNWSGGDSYHEVWNFKIRFTPSYPGEQPNQDPDIKCQVRRKYKTTAEISAGELGEPPYQSWAQASASTAGGSSLADFPSDPWLDTDQGFFTGYIDASLSTAGWVNYGSYWEATYTHTVYVLNGFLFEIQKVAEGSGHLLAWIQTSGTAVITERCEFWNGIRIADPLT